MLIYRVPVVIKGHAVLKCPGGARVGHDTGGLPSDAGHEFALHTPLIDGACMEARAVALPGDAKPLE